MMWKSIRRSFMFSVLFLASCVDPPSTSHSDNSDAAIRANLDCLKEAARQLDDNISPATSIAMGMVPQCAIQYQASIDASSRSMTFAAKQALTRRLEDTQYELKLATSAVLEKRAAAKRQP